MPATMRRWPGGCQPPVKALRAALQGRTTSAISANLAGIEMLMVGQPFESPATLHPKPVREDFECRAMPEVPLKGKTATGRGEPGPMAQAC